MKKLLASAIIASSLIVASVSANTKTTDEAGLYKAVILSRAKIEKDFGPSYNKTINTFFENMRVNPDFKKLDEIEARAERILNNSKNTYDRNYNLVANVYYRIKLLKNYQLKGVNVQATTTTTTNNSNTIITSNNTNNDIIKWPNLINNNSSTTVNNTNNNSTITNIISSSDKLPNTSSSTSTNTSKSLSFSYAIPYKWKEYKRGDEVILVDETYSGSENQNSVNFIITDYSRYNSVTNFRDEYKKELNKNYSVSDLNVSNIDGKTTYALSYTVRNEERNVYFVEYNGMVLVINTVRRNNIITNQDGIKEILNSIKISK